MKGTGALTATGESRGRYRRFVTASDAKRAGTTIFL